MGYTITVLASYFPLSDFAVVWDDSNEEDAVVLLLFFTLFAADFVDPTLLCRSMSSSKEGMHISAPDDGL